MYIVYNSQGVPVYTTSDEIEAEFVAMYEDGWYKYKKIGVDK